jgi:hypothetical protein
VLCHARHGGAVPHLANDMDVVTLQEDLIDSSPLEVHPTFVARVAIPDDMESLLLAPLRSATSTQGLPLVAES